MRRKSIGEQELRSVSNRLFDSSTQKKTHCYNSDVEDSGNYLLPFKQLKEVLESNVICRNCFVWCAGKELNKKLVHVTENTIGIATNLTFTYQPCRSKIFSINQPKTALENKVFNPNSNKSYQINCLLVLALQLLGGGCMSTDILLSFLSLPHGNVMKTSKFHCIESKLAPKICKMGEVSIECALKEEVYLQMKEENREQDFVRWMHDINVCPPMLTVSYDVGLSKNEEVICGNVEGRPSTMGTEETKNAVENVRIRKGIRRKGRNVLWSDIVPRRKHESEK